MVTKVLVAAVPTAQAVVERVLAGCPLDFVSSMEDGERFLRDNRYSDVLIGHLFAESRMFEFAKIVRARQPWARVICVKGAGRPLDQEQRVAINVAVRELGCEGFIDLTAQEIPKNYLSVFNDILRECRKNPQAP